MGGFCEHCPDRSTCREPCAKVKRVLEPVVGVSSGWYHGIEVVPGSEAQRRTSERLLQSPGQSPEAPEDPIESHPNPPSRTASVLVEYVKDDDVRTVMAEEIGRESCKRSYRWPTHEQREREYERETLEADIRTWPGRLPDHNPGLHKH